MVNSFFIVLCVLIAFYISCWLGVEMLAFNLGYEMTHLQKFLVPMVCFFSFFVLPMSNDEIYIKYGTKLPMYVSTSSMAILKEYILCSGKLSLCMWAVHKVHLKKIRGKTYFREVYYIAEIFDAIKVKLIERTAPAMKKLVYTVNVKLDISSASVNKPKRARETTMANLSYGSCKEVLWNYVS